MNESKFLLFTMIGLFAFGFVVFTTTFTSASTFGFGIGFSLTPKLENTL
jgi:hypothetical protein